MIDALVLAGSKNNGPLQSCSDASYEALIKIGPKVMVNYVINALINSGRVDRVIVVGPPELAGVLPPGIMLVESGQTLMDNIKRGSALLTGHFLLVTSDIPLLNPGAVDGFIHLCGDLSEDLYFPLVPREAMEEKFPNVKRTYVRFKEGVFTGGNTFLVNPRVVGKCMTVGQELVNLRKSPLSLARRVGIPLLLKMLLRVLSLAEAQNKASLLLGITGRAIICPHPEIGLDVDKPSDLRLVRQRLGFTSQRATGGDLCKVT